MLELRNISKSFDGKQILQEVGFTIADGEVVALLGPSGSGKSTLLSLIAGLELPDVGQILWDGHDLAEVPPDRRGFGLMFQDYALFPHRNVCGNVAFGLEMAGKPKDEIAQKVEAALARVGLTGFAKRAIDGLSGGEQQRVALARALAPQPRLLMLDEPLGSLDRALRTRLLADLAGILRQARQSSLYVTHDQEEAYAIADRIVILNAGKVAQIGAPEEIYRSPASAFVANFLGLRNLFTAKLAFGNIETPLGKFTSPPTQQSGEVMALFRPDVLKFDSSGPVTLQGKLRRKQFRGDQIEVEVAFASDNLLVLELPSSTKLPALRESVTISFDPSIAIQVLPRE